MTDLDKIALQGFGEWFTSWRKRVQMPQAECDEAKSAAFDAWIESARRLMAELAKQEPVGVCPSTPTPPLAPYMVQVPLSWLREQADKQAYASHDDSVGYRVCCGVASYRPHRKDCELAAMLAAADKEKA
jgi:hypothetical protein